MTQRQAAECIGVCVATYGSWESGEFSPGIRQYPRVYEFLGYCAVPGRWAPLGTRLLAWRRANGLTEAEVARMTGLDPGTVARMERYPDWPVYGRIQKVVASLLMA